MKYDKRIHKREKHREMGNILVRQWSSESKIRLKNIKSQMKNHKLIYHE